MSDDLSSSKVLTVDSIVIQSELQVQHEKWKLTDQRIPNQILSFVFSCLVTDVFSLSSFQSVSFDLGLSGGAALGRTLPLMFRMMENTPLKIQSQLLLKQLSASPLQRLVRDTLLTFQDEISTAVKGLEEQKFAEFHSSYPEEDDSEVGDVYFSLREASASQLGSSTGLTYVQQILQNYLIEQESSDISYDSVIS